MQIAYFEKIDNTLNFFARLFDSLAFMPSKYFCYLTYTYIFPLNPTFITSSAIN